MQEPVAKKVLSLPTMPSASVSGSPAADIGPRIFLLKRPNLYALEESRLNGASNTTSACYSSSVIDPSLQTYDTRRMKQTQIHIISFHTVTTTLLLAHGLSPPNEYFWNSSYLVLSWLQQLDTGMNG